MPLRSRHRAPAALTGRHSAKRLAAFVAGLGMAATLAVPVAASVEPATATALPPERVAQRLTIDTDLRSFSRISAWAIDAYLRTHTPLPPLGAAFKAAEAKYHVNALYLLAHAMHESGYGRSWLAQHRYNLFGWNALDRNPMGFATRFASYASAIDYVAGQIADRYLAPGGRYYGGASTLRGMRHYASDPLWAPRIASIANVISASVPTLRRRGITFRATLPKDPLVTGDAATVRIAASPANALPDGLRLAARIELATDAVDSPPTSSARNFVLTSARSRNGSFRLPMSVGPNPGGYIMDLRLVDSDGRPLPASDAVAMPTVTLDVRPLHDVAFSVDPGGGFVLRVANQGAEAVPALGPQLAGLAAGRPTTVLATWLLRAGDDPLPLAPHVLPADLAVAAQWDAVVDLGDAILQPGDVLLARLEIPDEAGAAEATLPAVFRVDAAPVAPGMDVHAPGAGAGDDPIALTPIKPGDPLAAAAIALVAPAPAVTAIAAGAPVSP
jgi:hypothetical protein